MIDSYRMDKDRKRITERILSLTLEIIYLLTGEDYTSVKTSSACATPSSCSCVSGGWGRTQSPILKPPLDSLIQERSNDEKILDLTNKIIELLTGEVPIRCQDITVHFSTEEWDYLEGHKDLYENIMIENHHPMTSLDGSCKRSPPESCHSSSLFSQGCPEEAHSDSQDDQGEDQTYIKVEVREAEETYVMGGQQYKEEENPVDIITDDCTKDSERYLLLSPHYETEENCTSQDISEEHHNIPQITPVIQSKVPSIDPGNHKADMPQFVNESTGHSRRGILPNSEPGKHFKKNLSKHKKIYNNERSYSCSYCGKCFTRKSDLEKHHKGGKPNLCSKSEKNVTLKSSPFDHQRTHLGEKTFSCVACGKCFTRKSALIEHKKIHLGNKPFSCLECFKTFIQKASLVEHQRIHTGEKPFQCPECGKCFTQKPGLINHQKIHTMEKPFSCLECKKSFKRKDNLERHQRIHRGEKPFCCSECRRCFIQRSDLFKHQRIHTRERPSLHLTYDKICYQKLR